MLWPLPVVAASSYTECATAHFVVSDVWQFAGNFQKTIPLGDGPDVINAMYVGMPIFEIQGIKER